MTVSESDLDRSRLWKRSPVLAVWLGVTAFLVVLLGIGVRPNGDADDIMKMVEIRHMLTGPSIFDRVIPGVLQPEPMISHWPWIADAPYALIAWLVQPVTGLETALQVAAFVVPLLLLAVAISVLNRINLLLGFAHPGAILAVTGFFALSAFAEFQPNRTDYHNVQMLLLCAVAWLTMRGGTAASAWCGGLTALSFAVSSEIAPFLLVPMAYLALRFVLAQPNAERELRAYGAALAASALAAFVIVSVPQASDLAVCDRFALPHLLALAGAGVTFALASFARGGRMVRLAVIGGGAAVTSMALVALFPICLAGPYGALESYLRQNWLGQIEQEMSLFAAPEAFSPARFGKLALPLFGAGAAVILGWRLRNQSRAWLVLGLFCLVGLFLSVAYIRYLRFLPLLATPGLAMAIYNLMPASFSTRKWFSNVWAQKSPSGLLLAAPAVVVLAFVTAARLVNPPQDPPLTATDIASACSANSFGDLGLPSGSRILTTPTVAMYLMDRPGAPEVVAAPFHTAAKGVGRVYRFFDPATPDPERWLAESGATHVATCRIDAPLPPHVLEQFPLAAGLAVGKPPAWLTECPIPGARLRVYRLTNGSLGCQP